MRVLITGAAGFLGSHLAERFITEGLQRARPGMPVTVTDN